MLIALPPARDLTLPCPCRNELKRRAKAERAAKKKAEKAAARAAREAAQGGKKKKKKKDEEELDPAKYYENRIKAIDALSAGSGGKVTAYPHKFHVTMSVPAFMRAFADVADGSHDEGTTVSLAGRVMSKRASGSKMVFYDLRADGGKPVKILQSIFTH